MAGTRPPESLRDYGWIASAMLLAFLSLTPLLLMVADSSPVPPTPPKASIAAHEHHRVVLLMVDGLGYDEALKMPRLAARMRANASGMALASFPTITPTGLRAIMSGHRMANEPQLPTGMRTWPEADSVIDRALAAGLKVHVFGQFLWPPLFLMIERAHFVEVPYLGPKLKYEYGKASMVSNYDDLILKAAEPVIAGQQGAWDLLVLHLFEVDSIAHAVGKLSPIYADHLRWLDDRLEGLAQRLQDPPTTVLLVADHGQADDGAHGGLSDVERQVPFVLWGADAKRAELGVRPVYDAAPTLSTLLGVPPPVESEGWPAFEGMRLSEERRAASALDLARQRLLRWRAAKRENPEIRGNPLTLLAETQGRCDAGKFIACRVRAEALARAMDREIAEASPDRWLWRLIAALGAVALSCGFGLAWNRARARTTVAAAIAATVGTAALMAPLASPRLWPWASGAALFSALVMLALTAVRGFVAGDGVDRYGWLLWAMAMAGIALRGIVTTAAWSWFVVVGMFAGRAMKLTAENKETTILSLATLLAAAASALLFEAWGWRLGAVALTALLLWGAYIPFVRENGDARRRQQYVFCVLPVAFAVLLHLARPEAGAWDWLACAISVAAMVALSPTKTLRGMWLGAVCLAYYRSLADDRQWCLLAAAVLVGSLLAWRTRDANPMWEGIGLIGLGLWSFLLSGGDLSFSGITVNEGEKLLGGNWRPVELAVLLTLKPLAAIGAPIMPRLCVRPLYSVLGILPLLGALTVGDLSVLWWLRFRMGTNIRFTDSPPFAQTIFVLLLAWGILAMWAAIQGLNALTERRARWRQKRECSPLRAPSPLS